MVYGDYQPTLEDNEHIYSYLRSLEQERLLIILNSFADLVIFNLPANINYQENKLLIGNYHIEEKEDIRIKKEQIL